MSRMYGDITLTVTGPEDEEFTATKEHGEEVWHDDDYLFEMAYSY